MGSNKLTDKVYCQKCKNKTNHGIITTHKVQTDFEVDDFFWIYSYHIVKCLGCDTVAFATEYHDEVMIRSNEFGSEEPFTDITVYPEEPVYTSPFHDPHVAKEFSNSPKSLSNLYEQIVVAYNLESNLLATAGLRILIEGICRESQITDGYILDEDGDKRVSKKSGNEVEVRRPTLEGKINGLVEKKLIVQTQANVLHTIRELGNASAHELEEPKRRTIKLAIEILERIMEQIYEYDRYKFELKKS